MSATDSDNSIDWLASDNEESDSGVTEKTDLGPPDSSCGSGTLKEGDSMRKEVREVSSWGSPGCTERRDRASATGLCRKQQGGKAKGEKALKRPHSSAEEQLFSQKDRIFSEKCMELQCYIHPLSMILNGLRSGRYKERLSSFQESVAMDRIQRIMGVLQNPFMGEKYMDIILKMEEMLKSWFPNVKLQEQVTVTPTEEAVLSKRLKISPMTCTAAVSPASAGDPAAATKLLSVTDLTPPEAYSANNLKWLHTSPICSPVAEQAQAGPRQPPPPLRDRDLTQDSAVSSSTDGLTKTDPVPRGPLPGKINAPCLERLLKSTDSIITRRGASDLSWS
ncbi:circadian-associated transcriptional repressor [Oryzias melastigma]|uniref:Circadian-associated transcriptional repressor-like n=1 Tax=Oryzias melastigma TaxID=30732 RepID=A0A3B3E0M4_ORYME|nr:circadian-associated transcriptional repressor [Oryzias melastigma]XP_024138104.1 circadian-associated transcriptional repressor [Oryzias melastigma]